MGVVVKHRATPKWVTKTCGPIPLNLRHTHMSVPLGVAESKSGFGLGDSLRVGRGGWGRGFRADSGLSPGLAGCLGVAYSIFICLLGLASQKFLGWFRRSFGLRGPLSNDVRAYSEGGLRGSTTKSMRARKTRTNLFFLPSPPPPNVSVPMGCNRSLTQSHVPLETLLFRSSSYPSPPTRRNQLGRGRNRALPRPTFDKLNPTPSWPPSRPAVGIKPSIMQLQHIQCFYTQSSLLRTSPLAAWPVVEHLWLIGL